MLTQDRKLALLVGAIILSCCLLSCSVGFALGSAYESNRGPDASVSTIIQLAASTETPRPSTATPKHGRWTTVLHFTGTGNTQTDVFDIRNGDHVVSSCTTDSEANLFVAYLYKQGISERNSFPYAQLVSTANQPCRQQTYTIQEGDAAVYLHVQCDYITWTVDIQREQ